MRVIKDNYVPEWPKQISCKRCKSQLEYEKDDVKIGNGTEYDRNEEYKVTYKFVSCPCCSQENILK